MLLYILRYHQFCFHLKALILFFFEFYRLHYVIQLDACEMDQADNGLYHLSHVLSKLHRHHLVFLFLFHQHCIPLQLLLLFLVKCRCFFKACAGYLIYQFKSIITDFFPTFICHCYFHFKLLTGLKTIFPLNVYIYSVSFFKRIGASL